MKNYEEMSDFEINCRVHAEVMQIYGLNSFKARDYCNNQADAGPIIIENRIGTIPAPDNGLWKAAHRKVGNDDTPYHFTQDKNPLRAAMIVFLKMNEDKL